MLQRWALGLDLTALLQCGPLGALRRHHLAPPRARRARWA
ncbi:Hypothetical protein A7982_01414 [Minicystis rosea]|nr:Hypothetical protein A7982_01414 [Minicystis rosea]